MSISFSGMAEKASAQVIAMDVSICDPLLKLCNSLDWEKLAEIAMPDLKATTAKGNWRTGRRLELRIHLGAYLLQGMYNYTDRATEFHLKNNAIYQVFCGKGVVERWHAPDATKLETFRSRLSPETHHALGEAIAQVAAKLGFAKLGWIIVDSTVQEANMSYPSDVSLMSKLAKKAKQLGNELANIGETVELDVRKVVSAAKQYFFQSRKAAKEIKDACFKNVFEITKDEIVPFIEKTARIAMERGSEISKKALRLYDQVCVVGSELLAQIEHFVKTGKVAAGKIMSLHLSNVTCIVKGKLGKPREFGRVFQLVRVPGNFLLIVRAKTLREEDKSAIPRAIYQVRKVFGTGTPESIGADRGYSSQRNFNAAKRTGTKEVAIQSPGPEQFRHCSVKDERQRELFGLRAGIEPLIGHAKHGGLGKSRMKTDRTTESAAYRAVAGFNLRQLTREIAGNVSLK